MVVLYYCFRLQNGQFWTRTFLSLVENLVSCATHTYIHTFGMIIRMYVYICIIMPNVCNCAFQNPLALIDLISFDCTSWKKCKKKIIIINFMVRPLC